MDQSQGGFALVLDCSFVFVFRQGTVEAMGVNLAKEVIFSVPILVVYMNIFAIDFS